MLIVNRLISKLLSFIGLVAIKKSKYDLLVNSNSWHQITQWHDFEENDELKSYVIENFQKSKSQLSQDLVAHFISGKKINGFFVEFGATDGIALSNTFLLEKEMAWRGILAEPARIWKSSLENNRSSAIDFGCVHDKSGEKIRFLETELPELSSIEDFARNDTWAEERNKSLAYLVDTISLNDLLSKHQAPRFIDYLSIDTEGSEYNILKALDFNNYEFGFITIEHNFSVKRSLICDLLYVNGYKRIYEEVSKWDDWFIPNL